MTRRIITRAAALCVSAMALWMLFVRIQSVRNVQAYQENALFKADVLRHVPLGTPVEEAQNVMQRSGFACSSKGQSGHWMSGGDKDSGLHGKKNQFLLCERTDKYSQFWDQWVVEFKCTDGKISGRYTNYGRTSS